jgi:hypothetical protein
MAPQKSNKTCKTNIIHGHVASISALIADWPALCPLTPRAQP